MSTMLNVYEQKHAREEAQNRKDCAWEAKVRRKVLKRLKLPLERARKAFEKEVAVEEESRKKIAGYRTEAEAHDAYGWDEITEEEYRMAVAILNGEETEKKPKTVAQAAYEMMQEFYNSIEHEARDFEWEALTPRQREKIQAETAELKAHLKAAHDERAVQGGEENG